MNKTLNTIFRIGYHGPYILMITAILMILYETRKHFPSVVGPSVVGPNVVGPNVVGPNVVASLLFISAVGNKILFVIAWNFMNYWLNGVLKRLIKQPRPKKMIKINRQDVVSSRGYGMPSGHAQIAVNNLVFLALLFRNDTVTALGALQTLLTIYQRYAFRMHSAAQLLAGTALGTASGYGLYKAYRHTFATTDHKNYKKHHSQIVS